MDKHLRDLIEVLTAQDGSFNEELQAYVTAYPINFTDTSADVVYEIEYVDVENDFEVIETHSFTVSVQV